MDYTKYPSTVHEHTPLTYRQLLQGLLAWEVLEEAERSARWQTRHAEMTAAIQALPDSFDQVAPPKTDIYSLAGDYRISLPRNEKEVSRWNQLLASLPQTQPDAFRELEVEDTTPENGRVLFSLRLPSCWDKLQVALDAKRDGSTCVLTQIGERVEVKKVPIYEVTCPDGAVDNPLAEKSSPAERDSHGLEASIPDDLPDDVDLDGSHEQHA